MIPGSRHPLLFLSLFPLLAFTLTLSLTLYLYLFYSFPVPSTLSLFALFLNHTPIMDAQTMTCFKLQTKTSFWLLFQSDEGLEIIIQPQNNIITNLCCSAQSHTLRMHVVLILTPWKCAIHFVEFICAKCFRALVRVHKYPNTHIHVHIVSASSFRRRNSGLAYQMNSYMYAFRTMPHMYYTLCDLQHYTSALLTICILACYFSYGSIYTNANFTSFHRFLFTTHFNGKQPPNKISKGILMVCSNHS